jgi:hypothetical protein
VLTRPIRADSPGAVLARSAYGAEERTVVAGFREERSMRTKIFLPALAAGAIVLAATGAEITYDNTLRSVTARAGSAMEPEVRETVSTTAHCSFVESVSATQSYGVTGTATQDSYIGPRSFAGTGAATARSGGPMGTGYGEGVSWMEVSFTIDTPTSYTLVGDIDGFGVYSFTGPGLHIEDMSFGPKLATFDETGVLAAGSFTFIISAESEAVDPTFDASFSLEVILGDYSAADITGPQGQPDGCVDALDFLRVIAEWGSPCSAPCSADATGPDCVPDGNVDALDYLLVIGEWGC